MMAGAFVPASPFKLRLLSTSRGLNRSGASINQHRAGPTACVAPRHVRRAEEIKRLTAQLEQLRASRAQISDDSNASASAQSTTPSSHTPRSASAAAKAPATQPTNSPPQPDPVAAAAERPTELGQHSAGSRFLSITSIDAHDYMPRILPLVGHIPGLTATVLDAAPTVSTRGSTSEGDLFVTDAVGVPFPLIAIESTDALRSCIDPVCVTIDSTRLSATKLPVVEGDSIVVILDRDTSAEVSETAFYAWDVDGRVEIGWVSEIPSHMRLIGRVVYGMLQVDAQLRVRKSAWEEENETYA